MTGSVLEWKGKPYQSAQHMEETSVQDKSGCNCQTISLRPVSSNVKLIHLEEMKWLLLMSEQNQPSISVYLNDP